MIFFTPKKLNFRREGNTMLTPNRKREIEDEANRIIEKHGLDKPGFDLAAFLTQRENFKVGVQSLDEDTTGLLLVNEREFINDTMAHNLIIINAELAGSPNFLQRRRFITAHEYGHYVLHKNGDEIYAHRDYTKRETDIEKEADYFARCLLMPRNLVEKTLSLFGMNEASVEEKVVLIARTFNVTEKKAHIRLVEDLVI